MRRAAASEREPSSGTRSHSSNTNSNSAASLSVSVSSSGSGSGGTLISGKVLSRQGASQVAGDKESCFFPPNFNTQLLPPAGPNSLSHPKAASPPPVVGAVLQTPHAAASAFLAAAPSPSFPTASEESASDAFRRRRKRSRSVDSASACSSRLVGSEVYKGCFDGSKLGRGTHVNSKKQQRVAKQFALFKGSVDSYRALAFKELLDVSLSQPSLRASRGLLCKSLLKEMLHLAVFLRRERRSRLRSSPHDQRLSVCLSVCCVAPRCIGFAAKNGFPSAQSSPPSPAAFPQTWLPPPCCVSFNSKSWEGRLGFWALGVRAAERRQRARLLPWSFSLPNRCSDSPTDFSSSSNSWSTCTQPNAPPS